MSFKKARHNMVHNVYCTYMVPALYEAVGPTELEGFQVKNGQIKLVLDCCKGLARSH